MDFETPIIAGRSPKDFKKFGKDGAVYLGKKYREVDENLVQKNDIYFDISGAHVMFICGKRGGGKSYTMGVIAEGFSLLSEHVRNNESIILLDTMGVYWTMKHPNDEIRRSVLESYGLSPKGVDVKIFTPADFYYKYKEQGIPTDVPFSLAASELDHEDWCQGFKVDKYSPHGILIGDVISALRQSKENFTIEDIMQEITKHDDSSEEVKKAVTAMFNFAKSWGVFSDKSTGILELAKAGQIAVLDVSCYATMPGGWDVKALIVGIVSKHLFVQRMNYRKGEEYAMIKKADSLIRNEGGKDEGNQQKENMPLVWLVIDEAHEFLPRNEEDANAATGPLIEVMREGRQPGISLILATQQPGKIHTDVMTQSDIVLSHRITAQIDVKALELLSQSYNKDGIQRAIDFLPGEKGSAVLFDDANEQIHQIKIRPRVSWHGGGSPSALKKQ
ncbi:MAG: ATP-binding protein [Nanobdellota archaeon]